MRCGVDSKLACVSHVSGVQPCGQYDMSYTGPRPLQACIALARPGATDSIVPGSLLAVYNGLY